MCLHHSTQSQQLLLSSWNTSLGFFLTPWMLLLYTLFYSCIIYFSALLLGTSFSFIYTFFLSDILVDASNDLHTKTPKSTPIPLTIIMYPTLHVCLQGECPVAQTELQMYSLNLPSVFFISANNISTLFLLAQEKNSRQSFWILSSYTSGLPYSVNINILDLPLLWVLTTLVQDFKMFCVGKSVCSRLTGLLLLVPYPEHFILYIESRWFLKSMETWLSHFRHSNSKLYSLECSLSTSQRLTHPNQFIPSHPSDLVSCCPCFGLWHKIMHTFKLDTIISLPRAAFPPTFAK